MQTQDPNLTKTPIDKSEVAVKKEAKQYSKTSNESEQYSETTNEKGTETLKDEYINSEHVKEGDNPARQPDRRDQQGNTPFDDNVNENTMGTERPQSDEITDANRYATVDNAQTRVLNEDLK
ncbi:hypothetical protein [Psychrobacter sanguinis]|uniref:hypothetical protein n=1 Tax=Psychrobacter sanguinis TaxID=861445 RepID=UPI0002FD5D9F|nr:hypothetical protein [Psychrobacter sanguinis]MCC3307285.1 hypothetical protein [Psychrobacter sanguinis]MCD9152580.1 hypothetical protein [Psychrobacter sanguinis]UEC24639.1 hypothetical protein LK453_08720 [Psychrobacter sanguinis]